MTKKSYYVIKDDNDKEYIVYGISNKDAIEQLEKLGGGKVKEISILNYKELKTNHDDKELEKARKMRKEFVEQKISKS